MRTRLVSIHRAAPLWAAMLSGAICLSLWGDPGYGVIQPEQLQRGYGELPLAFELNQGQASPGADYLVHGGESRLSISGTGAVLSLGDLSERDPDTGARTYKTAEVRLGLMGANSRPHRRGMKRLPGTVSYFLGNDPRKWRTGIPTYGRVEYQEVYPGIDLAYYGRQRELEYDLIVAPGANPDRIRLAVEGGEEVTLSSQGDLLIKTAAGTATQTKPFVYQEIAGEVREVPCHYSIVPTDPGSEAGGGQAAPVQVAFNLGAYDRSRPLVIDPVLSYVVGRGGHSIDVDSSGCAYFTGKEEDPTTGGTRAYVTKLDASGSAAVYTAFFDGSGEEQGTGVVVDASGNAYVTGVTDSTDFPTAGALQQNMALGPGGQPSGDAFVAKLDPTGTTLLYSTYLGGSSTEFARDIALDTAGNAYVVGETRSTNFPTVNAYRSTLTLDPGGSPTDDVFVAKLNPAGSALVYSTYLGGGGQEVGKAIAVDAAESVYVTGETDSPDFPTLNAFQPGPVLDSSGTPTGDAFVTKLSATGNVLAYSTYLGGAYGDGASDIAVAADGSVVVMGDTGSVNFPTVNPLQPAISTDSAGELTTDSFIVRLSSAGNTLLFGTYWGGGGEDFGYGVDVDAAGNIYVAGQTDSSNFPLANPMQTSLNEEVDSFVTKLDPTAGTVLYSTYQGSADYEWGCGLAVDSQGNVYITGGSIPAYAPQDELSANSVGARASRLPRGPGGFVAKLAKGRSVPGLARKKRPRRQPAPKRRSPGQGRVKPQTHGDCNLSLGGPEKTWSAGQVADPWEHAAAADGRPRRAFYWLSWSRMAARVQVYPFSHYSRQDSYWIDQRMGVILDMDRAAALETWDMYATESAVPGMEYACILERCQKIRREIGPNVPLFLIFRAYRGRLPGSMTQPTWLNCIPPWDDTPENNARWDTFISNVTKLATAAKDPTVHAEGILMDAEQYTTTGVRENGGYWRAPADSAQRARIKFLAARYVNAIRSVTTPRNRKLWLGGALPKTSTAGRMDFFRTVFAPGRGLLLQEDGYTSNPWAVSFQGEVRDKRREFGKRTRAGEYLPAPLEVMNSVGVRAGYCHEEIVNGESVCVEWISGNLSEFRGLTDRAFNQARKQKPWGVFVWPDSNAMPDALSSPDISPHSDNARAVFSQGSGTLQPLATPLYDPTP